MTTSAYEIDVAATFGSLTTRDNGRTALVKCNALLLEFDTLVLDFAEHQMTPSFADECIGNLAQSLGLEEFKRRIKIERLSASDVPLVRHVVARHLAATI